MRAKLKGAFKECTRFSCCVFIMFCTYKFKTIQLYSKPLYALQFLVVNRQTAQPIVDLMTVLKFLLQHYIIHPRELICRLFTQIGDICSSGTASRYKSPSQLLQCRWSLLWETCMEKLLIIYPVGTR